jgi:hypothetical protein
MGWELVRLPVEEETEPSADDLEALADAVREAARPAPGGAQEPVGQGTEVGRRGHLRVLRSEPGRQPAGTQPGGTQPAQD